MTVLIEETLAAVHRIAAAARPIMLDDLGLKAAIEWMTEEFSKRYDGISCNLVIALGDQKIERTLVTAAYRIVQECMTNVARHAKASKIHIVVAVRDGRQLVISVQDNGIGLERQREPKNGFGLLGIRERVKALAGSFELESIPGEGVSIYVTIPLAQADSGGTET